MVHVLLHVGQHVADRALHQHGANEPVAGAPAFHLLELLAHEVVLLHLGLDFGNLGVHLLRLLSGRRKEGKQRCEQR